MPLRLLVWRSGGDHRRLGLFPCAPLKWLGLWCSLDGGAQWGGSWSWGSLARDSRNALCLCRDLLAGAFIPYCVGDVRVVLNGTMRGSSGDLGPIHGATDVGGRRCALSGTSDIPAGASPPTQPSIRARPCSEVGGRRLLDYRTLGPRRLASRSTGALDGQGGDCRANLRRAELGAAARRLGLPLVYLGASRAGSAVSRHLRSRRRRRVLAKAASVIEFRVITSAQVAPRRARAQLTERSAGAICPAVSARWRSRSGSTK